MSKTRSSTIFFATNTVIAPNCIVHADTSNHFNCGSCVLWPANLLVNWIHLCRLLMAPVLYGSTRFFFCQYGIIASSLCWLVYWHELQHIMLLLTVHAGNYSQRRIHNRWLVAYTLIRNPSLQCLTGSRLRVEEDSKSENLSDTACGKSFPEVVWSCTAFV